MMNDVTVGRLLAGGASAASRDAIHIAIAPVIADGKLSPGQSIELKPGTLDIAVGGGADSIGIVDPFLAMPVQPGEAFWMFLRPNSVTGMRHHWAHPAFDAFEIQESREWLTKFASAVELSLEDLLAATRKFLDSGTWRCLATVTPDEVWADRREFWRHYERFTGERVPDHDAMFFRCAC